MKGPAQCQASSVLAPFPHQSGLELSSTLPSTQHTNIISNSSRSKRQLPFNCSGPSQPEVPLHVLLIWSWGFSVLPWLVTKSLPYRELKITSGSHWLQDKKFGNSFHLGHVAPGQGTNQTILSCIFL